ncbi:MAG TPA: hypothetical protein VEB22_08030 [Phycisphaerales bacterium]|nr:hypothetical protein [Phycisphaerales bacterium]
MRIAPLLLTLTLAAVAGCVAARNDDPALADGTRLNTTLPQPAEPTYFEPDVPSLAGLDRSAWPQTVFSVPQREVTHQPTYRTRPVALAKRTAVQRGEYPSEETAGESISDGSRGKQALEGLLAPLHALGDLVMVIPRAVTNHPLTPVRGPLAPVHRVPPSQPTPPAAATTAPPPPPANAPPPVDPVKGTTAPEEPGVQPTPPVPAAPPTPPTPPTPAPGPRS